jgi:hypothetical protein
MDTHWSGVKDRRSKGRTKWPEIYLFVETVVLGAIWYVVYLLGYKVLTVVTALVLVFYFVRSSIPRYKRVVSRQTAHKVINNAHKFKK